METRCFRAGQGVAERSLGVSERDRVFWNGTGCYTAGKGVAERRQGVPEWDGVVGNGTERCRAGQVLRRWTESGGREQSEAIAAAAPVT